MAKKSPYFIAIIPPKPVKTEVMELKQEVYQRFNSKAALRSPPHITLHMPFEWRADREAQLKEKLQLFQHDEFPFEVELQDFDYFEPRVVFVDVVKSEALASLQKNMVTFVRKELNILNADYKDRGFHPHMTIGFRDLKKAIFPEVKAHFSTKTYHAKFEVSDICLLKHNGKFWEEEMFF